MHAQGSTADFDLELAHRIRKRQFVGLDTNRKHPLNLARAWNAYVMA